MVRDLLKRIVVYPRETGKPQRFDIVGKLAALIDPGVGFVVPPG